VAVVTPIPIVALDVPDSERALALVHRLGDACEYYKVGSELYTATGPSIVGALRSNKHSSWTSSSTTFRTRFDPRLGRR
jgi:orotidine-5'-phosphate decarboxylase